VRFESSLSDEELAKTIKEAAKSGVSAIFLLRGGGSQEELARIGGFESIKAIIYSNIPFYTAIGHSFDRMVSLIEKVADGHFATPSIAGQGLGKLVYTVSELESPKGEVKGKPSKICKVVITMALELLLILLLLFLGLKLLPKFFARLFDGG
jgi:exonuclease VII large subunit